MFIFKAWVWVSVYLIICTTVAPRSLQPQWGTLAWSALLGNQVPRAQLTTHDMPMAYLLVGCAQARSVFAERCLKLPRSPGLCPGCRAALGSGRRHRCCTSHVGHEPAPRLCWVSKRMHKGLGKRRDSGCLRPCWLCGLGCVKGFTGSFRESLS